MQASKTTERRPDSQSRGDDHALDKALGADRSQTIAAVERAASVLMLFARSTSPTLGVTEIADELRMSKAAVHRILSSLRSHGLIEADEASRRYLLGPEAMTLGLRYLARLNVRQLALPALRELSDKTEETATLSVRTGLTRVYVDQVIPLREVIMNVQIGVAFPLHAGASSKAFLAFLPEDQVAAYMDRDLERLTNDTITDVGALSQELERIRQRGWAQSSGERQVGAASVAAPVFDHSGLPVAVVSICGPAERFAPEAADCAEHLVRTTRRLSAAMGYSQDRAGQG